MSSRKARDSHGTHTRPLASDRSISSSVNGEGASTARRLPSQFQSPSREHKKDKRAKAIRKEFWRPKNAFDTYSARLFGIDLLRQMGSRQGGIFYSKRNDYKQVYYVNWEKVCTCDFVPKHLIPAGGDKFMSTELGKGWVRQEALELLEYSYSPTKTESFLITGDLQVVSDKCQPPIFAAI